MFTISALVAMLGKSLQMRPKLIGGNLSTHDPFYTNSPHIPIDFNRLIPETQWWITRYGREIGAQPPTLARLNQQMNTIAGPVFFPVRLTWSGVQQALDRTKDKDRDGPDRDR